MFESWNLGYLLRHLRGGVLVLLLQACHGALVLNVHLQVSPQPAEKETILHRCIDEKSCPLLTKDCLVMKIKLTFHLQPHVWCSVQPALM